MVEWWWLKDFALQGRDPLRLPHFEPVRKRQENRRIRVPPRHCPGRVYKTLGQGTPRVWPNGPRRPETTENKTKPNQTKPSSLWGVAAEPQLIFEGIHSESCGNLCLH